MVSVRPLSSADAAMPSARIAAAKATGRIGAYLIMRSPRRPAKAPARASAFKGALMRFARFAVAAALLVAPLGAQDTPPTNDAPNPYTTVKDFFKLPDGRTWGSTSAVDIDKDGKSIWVAERCGQNSCLDRNTGQMSPFPPILKFDPSGNLVKSFGEGMIIFAHGIFVDKDGNVWVTDGQDNAPQGARGQPPSGATKGHQVYKFSPDGKLLMTDRKSTRLNSSHI